MGISKFSFFSKTLIYFCNKLLHLSCFSPIYCPVWTGSENTCERPKAFKLQHWQEQNKSTANSKQFSQNSQVGHPVCTCCTLQNKSSLQLCNKWDSIYYAHKLIWSWSAGNIIPLWGIHSKYVAFVLEQIDFPCLNFGLGSRFPPYWQLIFYCWHFINPVLVSCTS